jgi:transketolase
MTVSITEMANAIRALSMDAVEAANSGHPGMPMGMADVATVLFSKFLKFDAQDPHWPDRDRFVLSAGHGSMLIYSLLHLTGYAHPTMEEISRFRKVDSPCAGHPETHLMPGIEATTGPLGQGLAMAVGMAIAERHLNAEFGDALVDHHTWVIAGDGCLMEGVNHEAIGLAGHLKLGRLNVLWDDNNITIDGPASLSRNEDVCERYRAAKWHVVECNGYDHAGIEAALAEARESEYPTLVRCKTIIGKGAPNKEGTEKVHGSALGADEVAAARIALNWPSPAFEVPQDIADAWLAVGRRGADARAAWQERLASHQGKAQFERRFSGDLPDLTEARKELAEAFAAGKKMATRKASEVTLEALTKHVPDLVGGSADLTPSNNTKTKATGELTAELGYGGRYIRYGIREFGMAAAMNGMALHGGVIPYGGTFMVFSDYARPAIRLAALQETRSIFVMTHDSIGLGEDGPTHQPVEHLMALRVIPHLDVWRPCDLVETAEAWQLALERKDGPSLLALSRQDLPQYRENGDENLSAKGAYTLRKAKADRRVILIATGSEVEIAMGVADRLEAEGIGADVVSMPCWERFDAQDQAYKDSVLPFADPKDILRVSIEAGSTHGWERYTMVQGLRFGVDRFGLSGPYKDVYDALGLTVDKIAPQVIAAVKG